MSAQLVYSMFQDVLFPETESGGESDADAVLHLRRLKRYVPAPEVPVRRGSIVIFDLETTGLDANADRIIEIGAIKLSALGPVDQFSCLVHTDIELTDDIIKLTGISPDMLVGQPTIAKVLPEFLAFIEGSILVAHNAEFDMSMLKAACSRQGIDLEWPCFCTLKMARQLLPELENKKLDTLAAHYGLSFEARHRAIGDIKVTVGVLEGMLSGEGASLSQWSHFQPYLV
ncbi:MAG: 3'-5' exonuclease [Deltaproteobacteria bacterium]|nr:3'-5' exonuclease [Deltaproteobacteria bacterium]